MLCKKIEKINKFFLKKQPQKKYSFKSVQLLRFHQSKVEWLVETGFQIFKLRNYKCIAQPVNCARMGGGVCKNAFPTRQLDTRYNTLDVLIPLSHLDSTDG